MEIKEKNWRVEIFLEKKLDNTEPSREKNFAVEKFCKKILRQKKSNLGSSAAPPPPAMGPPAPRYHAGAP
jgi:hypothetical protein